MEEESTGMEVEHAATPSPSSNSIKRFGLKNSIQTNFGNDYVFQIVPKDDWTSMAVSLSTKVVKLYSPTTGQYQGECKGHTDTINQIFFSGNVLHSCSSDATIRSWDTRTFQQVSCINAGYGQEIFNFDFGGSNDNLLAAGSKSQIFFWDWRNKNQVACLEESHMDDVTQVQFVPKNQNKLLSASVDGLMCIFNTEGEINDDDHLESIDYCLRRHYLRSRLKVISGATGHLRKIFKEPTPFKNIHTFSPHRFKTLDVMNVGTSIGKVGFFGEDYQKLWCLTHIESLSIWDWKDSTSEANLLEARSLASDSWALDHIDYFVDCHSPGESESLWVIGGTGAGALGYFPVNYKGVGSIGSPEAILGGGHAGVVRSILPMSSIRGGSAQSQGIFGWTGGEDGRLCCWKTDDSSDKTKAWISSPLVVKSHGSRKKKRHQPY